jgi:hypothetical protein
MKKIKANTEQSEIDKKYGLEPVYEAGSDPHLVSMSSFVKVRCPHCFESYDSEVEIAYGSQHYIEDCQICCSAIELVIDIEAGSIKRVQALRPHG